MNTFEEALENTNKTNEQIGQLATQIVKQYSTDVDNIISHVTDHVNELDNNALRALVTDLSFKAFSLAEAKEYSSLKSEVSRALMNEVQATEFNATTGTVDARKNASLLNSQNEQLVKILCDTVSGLLKVKLDEAHRIVDTLKTVILSRNTEARINADINDVREGM